MRSLEQPLHSNMFRLQLAVLRQVSTMITLCSVAHFADRHRDASRRHHPTPATPFVFELCDREVLYGVGPCPRSRHEPSPRVNSTARSKLKNAKATNPACDDGLCEHV
jgi:hypothetical protein